MADVDVHTWDDDSEAMRFDAYLEDLAATVERTLAAADQFFAQITGRS